MAYLGLQKEKDIERWLEPFTFRARLPGYKVVRFESTKLFFHLYWKLLLLGFTEQQIADHAVTWGHRSQLPRETALVLAVFDLADHHELKACGDFIPPIIEA